MTHLSALWASLASALLRDPLISAPPELQPLVSAPTPPHRKWNLLDVTQILRDNVRMDPTLPPKTPSDPPLDFGANSGDFGALRTALSILEKYGRNLLQPRPPRHWRLVRFGNPVFKRTVDAIKGGRSVLKLLGYTLESPEGLGFPPGAVTPDVTRVAAVTAELLLLRVEIELLAANQHPNPQFFTQMLVGSEEPLAPDSPPVADGETPKREAPPEDPGWACASCTFLNRGPSVLCGVCERPRLARRPQPIVLPPAPPIQAPPIQAPPIQAPPTQREGPREAPPSAGPAHPGPAHEVERQRRLREDGKRLVAIVREAEAQGVAPEAVVGVASALGVSAGVAVGVAKAGLGGAWAGLAGAWQEAGLGPLSIKEAELAWGHAHGHAQRALEAAIGRRRRQLRALAALGFPEVGVSGPALFQNGGALWGALRDLQRRRLRPLLLGQWRRSEPPIDFLAPDLQATTRRALAALGLPSWGRAQLLVSLARELLELGVPLELPELAEAVGGCGDPRALRTRLRCRCRLCGWDVARKQAQWLTGCECPLCPECFRGHFLIGVKEKGVQDLVCPACGKPDLSDENARICYFSTLDTQLRQILDPPTYELFSQKLTELELQRDPQFLWCPKCSFGFILEGEGGPAQCPQCQQRFCPQCQETWLPQHAALSCARFALWLRSRDPQAAAMGLGTFLRDNGIACPRCGVWFALARGGCLHLQCSQCRHQFCSGCRRTFHPRDRCPAPRCPLLGSLHCHHPRHCLFFLRDWDPRRLQRLLQGDVPFDTDAPPGSSGSCGVPEQKETGEGLRDAPCGREVEPGQAGMCRPHYTEYLVGLIWSRPLDPAPLYTWPEALAAAERHLPGGRPPQDPGESDAQYGQRLRHLLMTEDPIPPRPEDP